MCIPSHVLSEEPVYNFSCCTHTVGNFVLFSKKNRKEKMGWRGKERGKAMNMFLSSCHTNTYSDTVMFRKGTIDVFGLREGHQKQRDHNLNSLCDCFNWKTEHVPPS